jgi:hypothetical protein
MRVMADKSFCKPYRRVLGENRRKDEAYLEI